MAQQKYSIVEKLDSGGMAEVWIGKATSLRGFEKAVAIKRVLPNLAKNKKFIAMFLDEARLSLFLNHANVVQTFDIGMSENSYFIVMEYVDGSNLKSILEIAHSRGFRLPQEQVAYVGIEVCKGLSHAHNRRDPKGRPLNIVHRDISPPNILISREGEVKLVDFGLAKAASQISQTDPGVVKGKFSYLSPEAAFGERVNASTDLFATGICMWEMLAGRRLFDGRTDLETVDLVRNCEIPPLRDFNPEVHPQLEAVIRRVLSRDQKKRHESAGELANDLARFLFDNRLLITAFDLAVLVKKVISDRKRRETDVPGRSTTSKAEAIEKLIRDEIGKFASIEDLERMAFKSIAEQEPEASSPTFNAIDPRDWADEWGVDKGDNTRFEPRPRDPNGQELEPGLSLEQSGEGPEDSSEETSPPHRHALEMEPVRAPTPSRAPTSVPPPLPGYSPVVERRSSPPPVPPAVAPNAARRPPTGGMGAFDADSAHARDERRASAAAAARLSQPHTSGATGGLVKGIVAGVVVAVALSGVAIYFFLQA